MKIPAVLRVLIALVLGGWMIFDGVHVLRTGKYFGPEEPGPWALLVSALGIDPFRLGVPFVMLGAAWLVVAAGQLLRVTWLFTAGVAVAVASLWYLPVGTVLSVAFLLLLAFRS